jgi:ribosomal protein L37E
MIVILATSSPPFMDHQAKEKAEIARRQAEKVTRERCQKCAAPTYKSPFKDCPDCGLDLRSKASEE